jgi:hypothetical protein
MYEPQASKLGNLVGDGLDPRIPFGRRSACRDRAERWRARHGEEDRCDADPAQERPDACSTESQVTEV